MDCKWLNDQQFNHQICLQVLNMIVLAINYHLVNKNSNILALKFEPFSISKGGKNNNDQDLLALSTQFPVNSTQKQHVSVF